MMSLLLTCQDPCVWVPRVEAWDSGGCGPSPGSRPAPTDQSPLAGRSPPALGGSLCLRRACVTRPHLAERVFKFSRQAPNSGSFHAIARRPPNSPHRGDSCSEGVAPARGLAVRPPERPCLGPGPEPRPAAPTEAARTGCRPLLSSLPLARAHRGSQTACCLQARPFHRGGGAGRRTEE